MYDFGTVSIGGYNVSRITSTLPDGTRCAAVKPDNWNGALLLDLDGAGACTTEGPSAAINAPRLAALFSLGYAYGGIERDRVGYRFPDAVDMLAGVKDAFAERFSEPEFTIAVGGSRGAFVGRFCAEKRPDVFSGALVYGGGGSGEIAALNSKLDGKWALNALLAPQRPLTLAGMTDLAAEEDKLHELIETAKGTPLGRARLALAAAFEQLPAWADPSSPEPGRTDWNGQFAQLLTCFQFAQFNFGTYTIEKLAGGPVSWNTDTDYRRLLADSGREDFVRGMYAPAGEGALEKDLDTLEKAPRVKADPKAVAAAEKLMTYTGDLRVPVVNLENIGDQVDPESCKYAYRATLAKRGREDMLRVFWAHSSGHCNFTNAEYITALGALMDRIRTGAWGDTSPEKLNAAAKELSLPVVPGLKMGMPPRPETDEEAAANARESRFFDYAPAKALHAWDFEDWDTYK